MIDAIDIISLNDYNYDNFIKEYEINNLISLDIPNNTELFQHYQCKIIQPSIDLNIIGESFKLFASKMTMANNSLITLTEDHKQILLYFNTQNKRYPFEIQTNLPLSIFIKNNVYRNVQINFMII